MFPKNISFWYRDHNERTVKKIHVKTVYADTAVVITDDGKGMTVPVAEIESRGEIISEFFSIVTKMCT